MYIGLCIHLSVWIYKWVGRDHGGRWPGRHVYIDLYVATYRSIDLLLILNIHTGLIIYIGLRIYIYTDRLTHIRSAGWQLDMYMFIYINGYLSFRQHIFHPEYTYRAYHIYRRVSALICMDI